MRAGRRSLEVEARRECLTSKQPRIQSVGNWSSTHRAVRRQWGNGKASLLWHSWASTVPHHSYHQVTAGNTPRAATKRASSCFPSTSSRSPPLAESKTTSAVVWKNSWIHRCCMCAHFFSLPDERKGHVGSHTQDDICAKRPSITPIAPLLISNHPAPVCFRISDTSTSKQSHCVGVVLPKLVSPGRHAPHSHLKGHHLLHLYVVKSLFPAAKRSPWMDIYLYVQRRQHLKRIPALAKRASSSALHQPPLIDIYILKPAANPPHGTPHVQSNIPSKTRSLK
ncbi:hypothetical protein K491DRAFT_294510 [Lophiostoma macrostomum CBS 122681]|uniref:C2H2-type domain-containing protein n=1 Tax=Lophiostoma macrostomum CBS 122681 TaxID=1314788 RepID=A0A6A6TFH1_9PLEO|nr:hypothetical protein K491DRAFT_294510 [Lophiostoma macrostomum CBS 122681]